MVRSLIALSFALLAVANSGCVLEPINWGEIRNDTTRFYGFFPEPDSEILVQALNPETVEWETIARTRSTNRGIRTGFAPFAGSDAFYYWDAGDVRIPERYWSWVDNRDYRCYVRVVMPNTGHVLPSYSEKPNLFADPIDEWIEKGNRDFSDRIILRTRDSRIPQDR